LRSDFGIWPRGSSRPNPVRVQPRKDRHKTGPSVFSDPVMILQGCHCFPCDFLFSGRQSACFSARAIRGLSTESSARSNVANGLREILLLPCPQFGPACQGTCRGRALDWKTSDCFSTIARRVSLRERMASATGRFQGRTISHIEWVIGSFSISNSVTSRQVLYYNSTVIGRPLSSMSNRRIKFHLDL